MLTIKITTTIVIISDVDTLCHSLNHIGLLHLSQKVKGAQDITRNLR